MEINFNGYDNKALTFACEAGVTAGKPVKLSGSATISAAQTGESFIGVALSVRDGYAAVQLAGYTELKKNGNITPGYVKLAAAAEGVKAAEGGREYLVLYTDADMVGFVL